MAKWANLRSSGVLHLWSQVRGGPYYAKVFRSVCGQQLIDAGLVKTGNRKCRKCARKTNEGAS